MGYTGTDTALTLPASCKGNNYEIYQCAFYNCDGLTSVTIPNSVTYIGYSAFSGCNKLESITLPFVGERLNGTSNMHFGYIFGASLYSYNRSYVPASLKTVVITGGSSIGWNAFCDCDGLTSITISEGVTKIGSYAFEYCRGLTSVTIPNSVTNIGDSAFHGCSGLTSIKYRGTEAQWKAISKGSGWNSNTGNYTITYNYTGE